MTNIILNEGCGNSPKNDFLVQLTTAYARGDVHFILTRVSEEITWNIVGERLVRGKMDFTNAMQQHVNQATVTELAINHVATHGRAGAVDGMMTLEDGSKTAFCHVFDFTSAKGDTVKVITTYMIALNN